MNPNLWAIMLAMSILIYTAGILLWVFVRPKIETMEPKIGKIQRKYNKWLGAPDNQIFLSKRDRKAFTTFGAISYFILGTIFLVAAMFLLFK